MKQNRLITSLFLDLGLEGWVMLMQMMAWGARNCTCCGGEIEIVMSSKGGRPRSFCEKCHPKKGINTTAYMRRYCEASWENFFTLKRQRGSKTRPKELSLEDCLSLLQEQNETCALTGLKMTRIIGDPRAASPDCIVPLSMGGTYHKGNVQLVCAFANKMRGTMTLDQFQAIMVELRGAPIPLKGGTECRFD